MLTAITRAPGPELQKCELTHLTRQPIDFARAHAQHRAYLSALQRLGIDVIELGSDPMSPDGVFVEDTAIVLNELAIIASPTPLSRRAETLAIEAALHPFRSLLRLPAEARLEGGDVLGVGRTLYVGLSARTNEAGAQALAELVRPYGYTVVPVKVDGCLHLKSACCALNETTLLINRAWIPARLFSGLRLVDVPDEEPWGANVLSLPGTVLVSTTFPRTADLVRSLGHATVALDVSDLHKAEAGLSCMSLVFTSVASG
jgi:dimethylargininase